MTDPAGSNPDEARGCRRNSAATGCSARCAGTSLVGSGTRPGMKQGMFEVVRSRSSSDQMIPDYIPCNLKF